MSLNTSVPATTARDKFITNFLWCQTEASRDAASVKKNHGIYIRMLCYMPIRYPDYLKTFLKMTCKNSTVGWAMRVAKPIRE